VPTVLPERSLPPVSDPEAPKRNRSPDLGGILQPLRARLPRIPTDLRCQRPGRSRNPSGAQTTTRISNRQIELLVCQRDLGTNRKLGTLAQMLPAARHEILLVNDSDIRVASDYLRRVVSPLTDPTIGMVTCLYRGIASPTLGSRLEALGISTDFVPGVLSARLIERGLHFGLGSTLAFRRSDLRAIGGFEAIADYLADDYEIGRRIAALGKRVELSEVVVDTFLPAYSLRQFVDHQLRWARSVRGARRWGYASLILTFGLPWALLTLLAARGAVWAWALFALTIAARLAVGLTTAVAVLDDAQVLRDLFLCPCAI